MLDCNFVWLLQFVYCNTFYDDIYVEEHECEF
jgi:hypothetical protein